MIYVRMRLPVFNSVGKIGICGYWRGLGNGKVSISGGWISRIGGCICRG